MFPSNALLGREHPKPEFVSRYRDDDLGATSNCSEWSPRNQVNAERACSLIGRIPTDAQDKTTFNSYIGNSVRRNSSSFPSDPIFSYGLKTCIVRDYQKLRIGHSQYVQNGCRSDLIKVPRPLYIDNESIPTRYHTYLIHMRHCPNAGNAIRRKAPVFEDSGPFVAAINSNTHGDSIVASPCRTAREI